MPDVLYNILLAGLGGAIIGGVYAAIMKLGKFIIKKAKKNKS